jgi:hypothetical protein
MPRYYFQLEGTRPFSDNEGTELADDAAAWLEAKRLTRDIEGDFKPGETWRLKVFKDHRPLYLLMICSSGFE